MKVLSVKIWLVFWDQVSFEGGNSWTSLQSSSRCWRDLQGVGFSSLYKKIMFLLWHWLYEEEQKNVKNVKHQTWKMMLAVKCSILKCFPCLVLLNSLSTRNIQAWQFTRWNKHLYLMPWWESYFSTRKYLHWGLRVPGGISCCRTNLWR